jgi:hypothetical protein
MRSLKHALKLAQRIGSQAGLPSGSTSETFIEACDLMHASELCRFRFCDLRNVQSWANLGMKNHGSCNDAQEHPAGGAGRAAATPNRNLSSRPCLSGQGMPHEALRLQPDGQVRDPRGTAAFPPTRPSGTRAAGCTEASDGGAGRAPGVDPRPRVNHQHPLAELRHPCPDLRAVRVAAKVLEWGTRELGFSWRASF